MARGNAARDTSFLPGPERVAPHLQEKLWKNCVDREERDILGGTGKSRPRSMNIISWEESSTRVSCGTSRGKADILSLEDCRCSTGASLMSARSGRSGLSAAGSAALGRRDTGLRLGTASSYVSTADSTRSSVLAFELQAEKKERAAAQRQVDLLRAELDKVKSRNGTPAGRERFTDGYVAGHQACEAKMEEKKTTVQSRG